MTRSVLRVKKKKKKGLKFHSVWKQWNRFCLGGRSSSLACDRQTEFLELLLLCIIWLEFHLVFQQCRICVCKILTFLLSSKWLTAKILGITYYIFHTCFEEHETVLNLAVCACGCFKIQSWYLVDTALYKVVKKWKHMCTYCLCEITSIAGKRSIKNGLTPVMSVVGIRNGERRAQTENTNENQRFRLSWKMWGIIKHICCSKQTGPRAGLPKHIQHCN